MASGEADPGQESARSSEAEAAPESGGAQPHSYLGFSRPRAPGPPELAHPEQVHFEPRTVHTLPAFVGPVAFPGQQVPLLVESPSPLESALSRGHLCLVLIADVALERLGVGVTALVEQFEEGTLQSASVGLGQVMQSSCLLRGVQRVRVERIDRDRAECTIVVEDDEPWSAQSGVPPSVALGPLSLLSVPRHAVQAFDAQRLALALRRLWCVGDSAGRPAPLLGCSEARALSFAVAASLACDDVARCGLLEEASTARRLRRAIQLVRGTSRLACASCGRTICAPADVFEMAAEGHVATFVNPAGVIHDTMTVRCVAPGAARVDPEAFTEHSWFPGYSWRMVLCAGCHGHLGWAFERVGGAWERQPMARCIADATASAHDHRMRLGRAAMQAQFEGVSAPLEDALDKTRADRQRLRALRERFEALAPAASGQGPEEEPEQGAGGTTVEAAQHELRRLQGEARRALAAMFSAVGRGAADPEAPAAPAQPPPRPDAFFGLRRDALRHRPSDVGPSSPGAVGRGVA